MGRKLAVAIGLGGIAALAVIALHQVMLSATPVRRSGQEQGLTSVAPSQMPPAPPGTSPPPSQVSVPILEDVPVVSDAEMKIAPFFFEETLDQEELLACYAAASAMDPQQLLEILKQKLKSSVLKESSLALKLAGLVGVRELLPLFELGLEHADPYARTTAIRGLNNMAISNEKTDALIRSALNDPDATTRKEAALYLRDRTDLIDDQVAEGLVRAIVDPGMKKEKFGRLCAVWALAKTDAGGPAVTRELLALYENGKNAEGLDQAIGLAAVGALARRGQGDATMRQTLLDQVCSKDENVRASSVLGLASWAEDAGVRQAVCEAVRIEGEKSLGRVYYAAGEFGRRVKDAQLANAFADALNRLKPSGQTQGRRVELAAALLKQGDIRGPQFLAETASKLEEVGGTRVSALGILRRESGQYFNYRPFGPLGDSGQALAEVQTYIQRNYR